MFALTGWLMRKAISGAMAQREQQGQGRKQAAGPQQGQDDG